MTRNAPFTVSEQNDPGYSIKLCAPLFVVVILTPIVVCGVVLGQWTLSLLCSIIAACVVLWVCVRSIISIRFVQRFPFIAEPLMRLFILMLGLLLLMSPIALYAGMHPGAMAHVDDGSWLVSFSSSIFSVIQSVGLSMSPSNWIDDARSLGVLSNVLLLTHAFLIILYAIACPLAAVFAALDAVFNGISDLRIKFWSWRKSYGSVMGEIYVFHELDEHGAALARSIIKTRKECLPLIVFANVGDLEASRDETLMEDLQDQARGKANLIYTSLPAESVPRKLSKRALETCALRFFAVSQNSTTNLITCGMLWDLMFERLWDETWRIWRIAYAKESRDLGPGDYGELCRAIAAALHACAMGSAGDAAAYARLGLEPKVFDSILRMGDRLGIHCLYTRPKDAALIDSIVGHNIETIEKRLSKPCQVYCDQIMDGVVELATCLRELIDTHALFQTELAVENLFASHPLYEVLDPIDLSHSDADGQLGSPALEEQQLTVLILGCGAFGTEVLKAASWLGRLAGTQLKIVVVDKSQVRQKMESLFLACPELMTEQSYSEDLDGPRKGKWSVAKRHGTPTVRFCEMDVLSTEMHMLLQGQAVRTMWYTQDAVPAIAESFEPVLSENDHLYCLVCLQNDDSGLSAALELQRSLAVRKMRAWRENDEDAPVAGRRDDRVTIAVHLREEYPLVDGAHGKNGLQGGLWEMGFPLCSFGSLANTFTYDSVSNNELKACAVQISALPARSQHEHIPLRRGEMGYQSLPELDKYSHRSAALSIPYKLWMLGLEAGKTSSQEFHRKLCRPANDIVEYVEQDLSTVPDGELRARWPLFSYLADLEHVRWCTFYRSLGWRDVAGIAMPTPSHTFARTCGTLWTFSKVPCASRREPRVWSLLFAGQGR
ncbi:MAG: hypothetical protein Q4A01_01750 [Coriobacteriales bacterium]|nr:hypothetical protein [Coriobacteriales bacterium]